MDRIHAPRLLKKCLQKQNTKSKTPATTTTTTRKIQQHSKDNQTDQKYLHHF